MRRDWEVQNSPTVVPSTRTHKAPETASERSRLLISVKHQEAAAVRPKAMSLLVRARAGGSRAHGNLDVALFFFYSVVPEVRPSSVFRQSRLETSWKKEWN
jgi:hypothetical protein